MVRIHVEDDLAQLSKNFSSSQRERAHKMLANQVLSDMDQFVPYRDGDLRASAKVVDKGEAVEYNTKYARAQFYGGTRKVRFKKYTTRGTGPRWDLKAKARYSDDWAEVYKKGLKL